MVVAKPFTSLAYQHSDGPLLELDQYSQLHVELVNLGFELCHFPDLLLVLLSILNLDLN